MNAFFQATNASPEQMCKELQIHYLSLKARAYDEQDAQLPITRTDFGSKYAMEAEKFTRSSPNPDSAAAMVNDVNKRCHSFLIEAISQVEKRLPPARDIFSSLSLLSPSTVLSQLRPLYNDLPMHYLLEDNIEAEEQYRKLLHVEWVKEPVFNGEVPTDPVKFWSGVSKCENSLGEHPFKELADYALTCHTAPVSNAICERIFSSVTCVKTKYRNRMGNKMLNAILRVRTVLRFGEKCCKDFEVSEQMLALFSSTIYYQTPPDQDMESKLQENNSEDMIVFSNLM